jgi:hypothetical protein
LSLKFIEAKGNASDRIDKAVELIHTGINKIYKAPTYTIDELKEASIEAAR